MVSGVLPRAIPGATSKNLLLGSILPTLYNSRTACSRTTKKPKIDVIVLPG